MGEFLKKIQRDEIAGPLRRNFKAKNWSTVFSAIENPDESDQNIYVSGLAISEKLNNIRSCLKLSTSPLLSASTKLRAFVAASNQGFFANRDKTQEAFKKILSDLEGKNAEHFRFEDFANVKLELPGGFEWKPDEIAESLVDGIEIPVKITLQDNPELGGAAQMNKIEWEDIILEINLGIIYRHTEDLWDECLWNGYISQNVGKIKAFIPTNIDTVRSYRIGLSRRMSLANSFAVMGAKFHRGMAEKGLFANIREVKSIKREGKRQVIQFSKRGELSSALEELTIMRAFASEPYYSELLEEPLPLLEGVTLSMLLRAWTVISRIATILVEAVGAKHSSGLNDNLAHSAWFPEYAPVLQVSALIDALLAAVQIKPSEGRRIVEFFTYRGGPEQEIWAQPMIPVGKETVAPIFTAAVNPNLRRLVDVWMRQGGIDLSKRGPPFESYIRATVAEAISTSIPLANNAICINENYTFRPSIGRAEQIDLVFFIDNTVFLAESKCILEPTEAKGVAMHRKTVEGAAEQVLRKADSLALNREEFVKDVKRFGKELILDFKIVPLIIVSTGTHVGVSSRNVAVIDELLLCRFLEGKIEDVAIQGDNLAIKKKMEKFFYADAKEAEAIASTYFTSPPQLQPYIKGLTKRIVPIHAVSEVDWEGRILTLECVPEYN